MKRRSLYTALGVILVPLIMSYLVEFGYIMCNNSWPGGFWGNAHWSLKSWVNILPYAWPHVAILSLIFAGIALAKKLWSSFWKKRASQSHDS